MTFPIYNFELKVLITHSTTVRLKKTLFLIELNVLSASFSIVKLYNVEMWSFASPVIVVLRRQQRWFTILKLFYSILNTYILLLHVYDFKKS